MHPGTINVALCPSVGIVAVSHIQVFWKPINSLCVLVPSMHQGEAVISRCANQTIDMALKPTGVNIISHRYRSGVTCDEVVIREGIDSTCC